MLLTGSYQSTVFNLNLLQRTTLSLLVELDTMFFFQQESVQISSGFSGKIKLQPNSPA